MKIAVTVAAVLVSVVCLLFLWRTGSEAYAAMEAEKRQEAYEEALSYCMKGPIAKNSDVESARMLSCMEYELGK